MRNYIKYLCGLCLLCVLCVSCHETEWDVPSFENGAPYGNNDLTEDGVISVSALMTKYSSDIKPFSCTEITEDIKIRVIVTGNDIQGNLYNSIAVEDVETGSPIIVCISGSDLFGYMPVGQELLIDLKGLYFGCYGGQPQIGTPYTNAAGNTFPSRMSNSIWQKHFKLIGTANPERVESIDFPTTLNVKEHAGKLMTIRNVSVQGANGKVKWASKEDAGTFTSVQKYFVGMSQNIMIYTSTFADFANTPIPTGKMNLTGIWKVYQTDTKYDPKWELVIRSFDDIDDTDDIEEVEEENVTDIR